MNSNTTISVAPSDVQQARRYFIWRLAAAVIGLVSIVMLCSVWGFGGPIKAQLVAVLFLLMGTAAIAMSTSELVIVLVFANKIKGSQLLPMTWGLHFLVLSSAVFYACGTHHVLPKSFAVPGMAVTGLTYFAIAIAICIYALKNIELAAASNKLLKRRNASK